MKNLKLILVSITFMLGFVACKKTSCDVRQPFYGVFKLEILNKIELNNFFKSKNLRLDSFKIINKETNLELKPSIDSNFNPKKYLFIINNQFPNFYPANGYNAKDYYDKLICNSYIFKYSDKYRDTFRICLLGKQNLDNTDCPVFYYESLKVLNLKDSLLFEINTPESEIIKIFK